MQKGLAVGLVALGLLTVATVMIKWLPNPPPPPQLDPVRCTAGVTCKVNVTLDLSSGVCQIFSSNVIVPGSRKIEWTIVNPQDGYKFASQNGVALLNTPKYTDRGRNGNSYTLDNVTGSDNGIITFAISNGSSECRPLDGTNPYIRNR